MAKFGTATVAGAPAGKMIAPAPYTGAGVGTSDAGIALLRSVLHI